MLQDIPLDLLLGVEPLPATPTTTPMSPATAIFRLARIFSSLPIGGA
jgi:hypothetical protein